MILFHHLQGIADRAAPEYGHRIINHAVFSTLHGMYLPGLFLNRHVFVDNADAPLAGYGNGHLGLCDRVHGRRHQRNIQRDVARKLGFQLHASRKHLGISRYEQNVVESQTVHLHPVCNK